MKKSKAGESGDITGYIEKWRDKTKGKVKAAIEQRWNTRVVPRGLDKLGREGVVMYLESYGKGISAAKVAELAVCAEAKGAAGMAAGFWEEAFRMDTGFCAQADNVAGRGEVVETRLVLGEFPKDMQPGSISTMQAVDAQMGRGNYIEDDEYYGQPKRDGTRNVLFVTPDCVVHQSRSTTRMPSIDRDMEDAFKRVAKAIGSFVLDGERYYLGVKGTEHRTAAQAATANMEAGCGEVQPVAVYGVFKALYAGGRDLRSDTEDVRIEAGRRIAAAAGEINGGRAMVEFVPTAKTKIEKSLLVQRQKAEGREGEVWVRKTCSYSGGKGHKTDMVRTKYLTEAVYTVASISTGSGRGKRLASVEVCDSQGVIIGSVGSGFDEVLSQKLLAEYKKNPSNTKVLIRHQGTTETGKLWHARILETA